MEKPVKILRDDPVLIKLKAWRTVHESATQLCIRCGDRMILNVELPAGCVIDAVALPEARRESTHRQK